MTTYERAKVAFNPRTFLANKKITAEQWNALWMSVIAQGNRQEDTLADLFLKIEDLGDSTVEDILSDLKTINGQSIYADGGGNIEIGGKIDDIKVNGENVDIVDKVANIEISKTLVGDRVTPENTGVYGSVTELRYGPWYIRGEKFETLGADFKDDYAIVNIEGSGSFWYMYDGSNWVESFKVNDRPFTDDELNVLGSWEKIGDIGENSSVEDDTIYGRLNKIEKELFPTLYPTLTNPSVKLEAPSIVLYKVGTEFDHTFTYIFDKGKISPYYDTDGSGTDDAYRSGEESTHIFYKDGSDGGEIKHGLMQRIIEDSATSHSFKITVNYGVGKQPTDSEGNDWGSPLGAGSTTSNIVTVTWEYPYFVDGVEQALTTDSVLTANFKAEVSGGEKQTFKTHYEVTGVTQLNTLSNTYDAIDLNTFTKTIVDGYYVYTHNGNRIGERKCEFTIDKTGG